MSEATARLIAFYLPQFHPIPENDEWWGKGFTEWTNAARAKPLFKGHYQPHVPADLGFYDLRLPEAREAQAQLAREHGIEAFCYYHYWFAGRRILERPFNEVLASGEPDFPFCLCWANATWSGVWYGEPKRVLIQQTYPGETDTRAHFAALLPAFRDRRYVKVDGKPLFAIFEPGKIPEPSKAFALWRRLAQEAGLPGLYLAGCAYSATMDPAKLGLDAAVATLLPPLRKEKPDGMPSIYRYRDIAPRMVLPAEPGVERYPCVVPNFDNTPRSGTNGLVLRDSTPELFAAHLKAALDVVKRNHSQKRLVFIKSWNEWAEGNHLEPDLKFGRRYLEAVRQSLERFKPGRSRPQAPRAGAGGRLETLLRRFEADPSSAHEDPEIRALHEPGGTERRPRVALVGHDAGISGASLVYVDVARSLARWCDVYGVLPDRGALKELVRPFTRSGVLLGRQEWLPDFKAFLESDFRRRAELLVRYIKDEKIDLVVSNTSVVAHGAIAAALSGKPHLWYVHDLVGANTDLRPAGCSTEFIRRTIAALSAVVLSGTDLQPLRPAPAAEPQRPDEDRFSVLLGLFARFALSRPAATFDRRSAGPVYDAFRSAGARSRNGA